MAMSTAAQRDQALRKVRAAAEEYHRAAAAAAAASDALEAEVIDARRLRVTWPELADASSLTVRQLQWRVPADEVEPAPVPVPGPLTPAARRGPRPGRGPGVGIEEASKILGVSRTSIYKWIKSGRLKVTVNELGQRRVLGLEDGAPDV